MENNTQEKDLIERNESTIFGKIKNFFRNLFKINNQQYIEAPKEVIEPISNMQEKRSFDFKNQIVVANEEEERIIKLQKDLKAGLIEEEDLSEEDFDSLTKLYESQIEKTKQSIQRYKNRIVSIKSKLAQNN